MSINVKIPIVNSGAELLLMLALVGSGASIGFIASFLHSEFSGGYFGTGNGAQKHKKLYVTGGTLAGAAAGFAFFAASKSVFSPENTPTPLVNQP